MMGAEMTGWSLGISENLEATLIKEMDGAREGRHALLSK